MTGVEIGVSVGSNAAVVFEYLKPKKYYLIDPYKKQIEGYFNSSLTQASFDEAYKKMFASFNGLPNVVIKKMTSEEAAPEVENDLDFVYVDGSHIYEAVNLDLNLWYPKIRSGGVLCGDDYNAPGVEKAVDEFVSINNLKMELSIDSAHPTQFWIIKP